MRHGSDSPFHGGGGHQTFLHLAFNGTPLKYREQARPFDLDSENVFEAFYTVAVTPFFKVTADIQALRPMLKASGVAVLPGLRVVVDF
jgi:hypothetical protein